MSTFSGRMQEFPHIAVDRFDEDNKNSKMFFLSHCHTDHMRGLDDRTLRNMLFGNLNVYLYASPISVRILKNMYRDLSFQLKELPLENPILIKLPSDFGSEEKYLTVRTIPAGHCPGSVMFLFESENKTVLYTGDFRVNTRELHKYKAFHTTSGDIRKIDNMYLDTTFCSPMYEHFSSREESMQEICKLVEEWITVSDNHIIDLSLGATYGSEYLFMEIFKRTNESIHVIENVYNLHKFIPDMANVITRTKKRAKIHTRLYFMSCCDHSRNPNLFVRSIRPTAIVWDNFKPQQSVVRKESETLYRVCYSSHASYSEIKEFVRYLKPSCIEACVVPEELEEKEKLLVLLADMIDEYRDKAKVRENSVERQFFIDVNRSVEMVEQDDSLIKLKSLSSPPRNFKRKRGISEASHS